MGPEQIWKLLIEGTPLELLALFIMAGYFQMIVYGWVHKAVVKERDEWKAIAQEAVRQNTTLVDIMESAKRGK
jgi:hypothetical protein